MGLASHRVLQLTGARLWLHEHDAEFLGKLTQFEQYQAWAEEVLRRAGVTVDLIAQIRPVSEDIRKSFHKLEPDRLLRGGEKISSSVGELEVIWTPGHSPGHVCLYGRERRVLFSGDQMLEDISPNIGWHENRDPLGEFLASLDALASLDIELILPSHGAPFSGHRNWIRKTIEHHADRCARILRLLSGEPKCAAELANWAVGTSIRYTVPLPLCGLRSPGTPGIPGAAGESRATSARRHPALAPAVNYG